MTTSTTRSAIKTLLESVSGIGRVHSHKQYSSDWASYKDKFIKNSKVNEWEIQRESFSKESRGSQARSGKVKDKTDVFVIRGFYAFTSKPSSEEAFDLLIDLITDEFIQDRDLGGAVEIIEDPITGEIFFARLGEVLCHVVEIRITVKERTFL